MVDYELLAMPQRDIAREGAAECLRAVSDTITNIVRVSIGAI